MQQSTFEKLGVTVSKLGFGCMRLPTKDGAIDREAAFAMVDYAHSHGITYFDTAWPYHSGESEPFMGEALSRYPRDSYCLATKMPVWLVQSAEDFERIFNEQLERLRTDHFDFYLLHSLDKKRFDTLVEQGLYDLLAEKKRQGKVRFMGFSIHDTPEVLDEITDKYSWDFAQIQYNYIDPHLLRSDEMYAILERKGIPAVVMEPVRGGFLATLPSDLTEPLRAVSPQRSDASWALRWVAEHPNVKVVLSGMSSMEQLVDNVDTFSGSLSLAPEEKDALAQVVQRILSVDTVPCTGCEYCMPCPFGVNIPHNFSVYNNYLLFRNAERSKNDYFTRQGEAERADVCRSCGKCVQACPQHIAIPDKLKLVRETMASL